MESMGDLMAFNSPPTKIILPKSPAEKPSLSPGSNPFDTLLKAASDCSYKQALNETNILDVAFVEGATFVFTQTLSSDKRDSLFGIANLNGNDCSRESLGILHINFEEMNEKIDEDVFVKDTLNVQSPYKSSYRSFLKSISSRSSQSSQPSTIYSIQQSFQNKLSETNLLNVAMSPTLIAKHLKTDNSVVVSPRRANSVLCFEKSDMDAFRKRIASGPPIVQTSTIASHLKNGHSCKKSEISLKMSDENKDTSMDDLVFVEISHTAAKIADGSILEETSNSNMLDCTPAPDFESIDDNIVEENRKCDRETVFKMIDKMLPVNAENTDKSNSKNSSNSSDNVKVNSSQHSAKEAIQSLAEILNSEHLNENRKLKGQHLLKSLAGILCNENNSREISSLDDSGHSSINVEHEEKAECYEVLDLRKKSDNSSETDHAEALDLSVGVKNPIETPKSIFRRRASVSLKEMSKPTDQSGSMVRRASESSLQSSSKDFTRNQSMLSNQTGSSNASGVSLLNAPAVGKLKLRKVSVTKSGPVKAVVGFAKKISSPCTPRTVSGISKSKKTSTPVNKPKMKPVAQSTPEEGRSGELSKKKFDCPMSPLSRPIARPIRTGSDPDLKSNCSDYNKLNRSNSTSNVKNKPSLLPMQRSYSNGKGIGLKKPTSETDKLKSNIRNGLDGNVLNRSLNNRSFSLLSKWKKVPGKENAGH